jgi:hypothetical protein
MDTRELLAGARRLYFRRAFPRYAKDYLRHNRPWDAPRQVVFSAFARMLLKRAFPPRPVTS